MLRSRSEEIYENALLTLKRISIISFILASGFFIAGKYLLGKTSPTVMEIRTYDKPKAIEIQIEETKKIRINLPKGLIVKVIFREDGIEIQVTNTLSIFLSGKWIVKREKDIIEIKNPPKLIKGKKV
jgi:hypothetical protein